MKHHFTVGYLFCGAGIGAYGGGAAEVHFNGHSAVAHNVGGIDFDEARCEQFRHLTGAPAMCADIGSMTPEELRAFFGPKAPWKFVWSPPCKGASGLLPTATAATEKYRNMNKLAVRALELLLKAWEGDELPVIILIENVPAYRTRCKVELKKIERMLAKAGYTVDVRAHNLGEEAGLAQDRKRLAICARDPKRCPVPVDMPTKKRLRGVGEVLGSLPWPDDPRAGRMHRLPNISWLNAVRLALVPPGGDWRDLPKRGQVVEWLRAQGLWPTGVDSAPFLALVERQLGSPLKEGQARRTEFRRHPVQAWAAPAPTVSGPGGAGPRGVEDPRVLDALALGHEPRRGASGVTGWDEPSPTVRGVARHDNGAAAVADGRVLEGLSMGADNEGRHTNKYAVQDWERPGRTVTGAQQMGSGGAAVADPRLEAVGLEKGYFANQLALGDWGQPGGTVTGAAGLRQGALSVADERPLEALARNNADPTRGGAVGVMEWGQAAPTVTGHVSVTGSNTPGSIADPRALESVGLTHQRESRFSNQYKVRGWEQPSGTVTGDTDLQTGAPSVADSRPVEALAMRADQRPGACGVMEWERPAGTIIGQPYVSGGSAAVSVADPRLEAVGLGKTGDAANSYKGRPGLFGVGDWSQPSPTVVGHAAVSSGNAQAAVADPRLNCLGTLPWGDEDGAALLPPRLIIDIRLAIQLLAEGWKVPKGMLAPAIISPLSGCWHRPLTTLELGVLQGLPPVIEGKPLDFVGNSDAEHRSMIGDGIPAGGALVWMEQCLLAGLRSKLGEGWSLSGNYWFEREQHMLHA